MQFTNYSKKLINCYNIKRLNFVRFVDVLNLFSTSTQKFSFIYIELFYSFLFSHAPIL